MEINRLELLGLLKALSPATASSKNQVPELSCVWFDGEYASAFNDVLGIRVAFPSEFTGGIAGDKLAGVLERSRTQKVLVEVDGEDALFAIGRAKIKLSRRPIEDWFWEPEIPSGDALPLTKKWRSAIDAVLLSVGSANVLRPEQRGITVIQNGKAVDFYSTDALSVSWMSVESSDNRKALAKGSRLILPTLFCEQIRALKGEAELKFDENAVYCLTDVVLSRPNDDEDKKAKPVVRDVLIFAKLVEDDDPVSFEDVVSQHVTDDAGIEIPSELKLRAERAMVLLGDEPARVTVSKTWLQLYAQTAHGEVDDKIKIGAHPEVAVRLNMALVHRGLDSCDHMVIAEDSVVMTGPGNFVYIVSVSD